MERYNPVTMLMEEVKTKDAGFINYRIEGISYKGGSQVKIKVFDDYFDKQYSAIYDPATKKFDDNVSSQASQVLAALNKLNLRPEDIKPGYKKAFQNYGSGKNMDADYSEKLDNLRERKDPEGKAKDAGFNSTGNVTYKVTSAELGKRFYEGSDKNAAKKAYEQAKKQYPDKKINMTENDGYSTKFIDATKDSAKDADSFASLNVGDYFKSGGVIYKVTMKAKQGPRGEVIGCYSVNGYGERSSRENMFLTELLGKQGMQKVNPNFAAKDSVPEVYNPVTMLMERVIVNDERTVSDDFDIAEPLEKAKKTAASLASKFGVRIWLMKEKGPGGGWPQFGIQGPLSKVQKFEKYWHGEILTEDSSFVKDASIKTQQQANEAAIKFVQGMITGFAPIGAIVTAGGKTYKKTKLDDWDDGSGWGNNSASVARRVDLNSELKNAGRYSASVKQKADEYLKQGFN